MSIRNYINKNSLSNKEIQAIWCHENPFAKTHVIRRLVLREGNAHRFIDVDTSVFGMNINTSPPHFVFYPARPLDLEVPIKYTALNAGLIRNNKESIVLLLEKNRIDWWLVTNPCPIVKDKA